MSPSTRRSGPARQADAASGGRPWLTGLLALACAVGFAAQLQAEHGSQSAVAGQLDAAAGFLLEHPYLAAPPLLEQRVGPERIAEARQHFESEQAQRGAPPVPAGIARRHQAELDRRMQEVRRLLADVPAQRWGLRPGHASGQTLVGHPFVHLGWLHLLGVLALLGVLGVALEAALGTLFVTGLVVLSAAGAGLAYEQLASGANPYVGMSGLLAGLWGAFLVRRSQLPRGASAPAVLVGAVVLVLPAALGLELAVARPEGLVLPQPGAWNASNWALLGGLASGALGALVLGLAGLGRAQAQGRNRTLERALAQLEKGRRQEAYEALVASVRRDPDDHDAAVALWGVAVMLGRTEAAAPALLRAIRQEVERGQLDSALSHWLELVACDLDTLADPGQLIRMATLLRDAGESQAALRALRAALDRAAGAAVASRIAREASLLDPRTAEEAAWRALGSLELSLEERQSLETLLGTLQPRFSEQPARSPERPQPEPPAAEADAQPSATPRPAAIDFEERVRPLECALGVPLGFDDEGLQVEVEGGRKKRVRFERIEAVSVASVEGLAAQPVLLVDLVLNWMSLTAEPLRLIRLRCDRFDPRRLVPGHADPLDALRVLVKRLLHKTEATPLPDLQSASGMPFAGFPDLATYQRNVLMVEAEEQ